MLWGTVEYHDKSQFCLMRISLRATNTLYLKSVCHEPLYETKWKEEDESYNEASKIIKTRLVHSFKRYKWSSVQFSSIAIVSDSLWPHGLQHPRLPCPAPAPRAFSNSYPLSQWCYTTIYSSVVPFSSCLQSFPASGSFPMSQFLTSGDQSIGVSASASVLPMNIQDWFPLGLTGLSFL